MDPVPNTLGTAPAERNADQGDTPQNSFGKIETRGIDRVPENERRGRPSELFPVWMSSNIGYLYILFGGILSVLGLSVAQSFTVLIAGNLMWALVGLQAITGPASGTPSQVVTRAIYGIRGNRILGSGIGWLVAVAYEGINLAIGALAGFSLLESVGVHPSTPLKVALTVALGIGTFILSLYGHATIVRFSVLFTVVLGVSALALGGFVTRHATLHPDGFTPLHGHELWVAVSIGFTVIASAPLSWSNGADYSRYLPTGVSKTNVALSTAAGGFIPAVVMGGIGILAGTAVDMSDPETAMRPLVPGWFYTVFLALIILSSLTNNVLTTYSSGLYLQALGVRMSRARSVIIDAALGGALCAYALLAPSFLTSLNNILALTVAVLGPTMAVYATDIVLRRNAYDGIALHREHPGGPFWYRGGYHTAGITAVIAGTLCALFFVNTTVLVGAAAGAMGGIDLSAVVGPVVAAVLYILLSPLRKEARQ
ncbi:cytosine permease [Streptomyces scabiei]|uniref:purine-cytosine permease family protein n=1 Tax=Streptomyces scabiei TaxID=1930 RepID=UPI00298FE0C9|nr:cytosine permease [Streptomyces scabiei]MDW8803601.1 cytosine permease [Streptomyces scabiei]